MTDDLKYRLSLSGDGLSLEREIDQATALSIMNIALGGAVAPARTDHLNRASDKNRESLNEPSDGNPQKQKKPISVKEFVHEKEPHTNPDLILSIAAYIVERDGKEYFTRDEVKALFPKAGEPLPKNYARDFAKAVEWGWISEHLEHEGSWFITISGVSALSSGFGKDTRKVTTRTRRRTKSMPSTDGGK